MIWLIGIPVLLVLLVVVGRVFVARSSTMPSYLGVTDGKLAECRGPQACHSTQTDREERRLETIPYQGDAEAAQKRLVSVLAGIPRVKFVAQESHYVHVEFRSFTFGFVDDAEFYFDDEAKEIHSRVA